MMNNIDILIDVLDFSYPNYGESKANITLELLNSGIKNFQISQKQYENLKTSIQNRNTGVYVCFGYNYIWSEVNSIDFLVNTFNSKPIFDYEDYNKSFEVKLSVNSNQSNSIINNVNNFKYHNKHWDLSKRISENEFINLISEFGANYIFNNLDKTNENSDFDSINIHYKNESYPYQQEVSKLAYFNKVYGFFMEPGMGKTKTSLDTACTLIKNKVIEKVLVFPPANLVANWKEEIEIHADEEFHNFFGVYSNKDLEKSNRNKTRIKEIKKLLTLKKTTELEKEELTKELKDKECIIEEYLEGIKSGKVLIILDEFHNFKNPEAIKTKYLLKNISENSRLMVLSATPFPKNFQDMFVAFKIFNIVKHEITWFQFSNFFFNKVTNSFGGIEKLVLKPNFIYLSEVITSLLHSKASFIKKESVLKLPDKHNIIHYYEPTEEQKHIIQNVLNNVEIPDTIDKSKVPFKNTELKKSMIKIQQYQGGFYLNEEKKHCELKENPKFDCLLNIIKHHKDGKLIIFCALVVEADLITKKLIDLGYRVVCKHGKLKKKIAAESIKQFKSEDFDILVATGDSAGTGLTLIESNTIIYYSINFNSVTREQSDGRIHRVGQKRDCTYHDLLSQGGIDEIIYNCVKRKNITKDEMFNKLKKLKNKDGD